MFKDLLNMFGFPSKKEQEVQVKVTPTLAAVVPKAPPPAFDPQFSIVSSRYTEGLGIQMEFDWNEDFITYLKANGITAATPEAAVHKWVSGISKQVESDFTTKEQPDEFL